MVECRPLFEIAHDIRREWRPVNFAARPYLEALESLSSTRDMFGADSGTSMVAYFLSNASQFKGNNSKALKDELRVHLKGKCDRVLPGRLDVPQAERFRLP